MIKEELEVDAAVINGATLKGDKTYGTGKMTYAELKAELPFPTKMVVVPMKRYELQEAIHYSRTAYEDGTDLDAQEIPRRGYLQVDDDYDRHERLGDSSSTSSTAANSVIKVALPRNLLGGFCKIKPLMEVGKRLKEETSWDDDYMPAIDLIVRHACKNQWGRFVTEAGARDFFRRWDLNGDGVLEFDEVRAMLTEVLGHEPADFMVTDMIASIDKDENGVIDEGEISLLLAQIEREMFWKGS